MRPTSDIPTFVEFELLVILWRLGPSTSSEILAQVQRHRTADSSAINTILRIMRRKRLIAAEGGRPTRYTAIVGDHLTRKLITDRWLSTYTDGTLADLFRMIFARRTISAGEANALAAILDTHRSE